MARGYQDYFKSIGKTAEGNFLPDIAIPPTWYHDDFNVPSCKWWAMFGTATIRTEYLIAAPTSHPYTGSGMMLAVSAVGGLFNVRRSIGVPPQITYLGFSMVFLFSSELDWQNVATSLYLIGIDFNTGAQRKRIEIYYNPRDYNWYYRNSLGGTTLIGNLELDALTWHYAKLIIDPTNDNYVMLQVDQQVWSLSGISYQVIVIANPVEYDVFIQGDADAADTVYLLVDDYKVTYGET